MIFGHLWMKRHGVLLNMINNSIILSPGYCIHLGAPLSSILLKPERIKKIPEVRQ